jgi:hypothetical protein
MHFSKLLLAGCLAAAVSLGASAQTPAAAPVGYVKSVTGEAWVTTAGQRVKAAPGTPVQVGSQIRTQPGATLGLTFKDNTVVSFGPDTEFTVDAYAYEPAQGKLGLAASLARGTLSYISGVIAKLQADAVTVKTPTGIIGVRGTEFVAKVEAP